MHHVSIYALEKYIGEDDALPDAIEQIGMSKPDEPVAKTAKGIDKTKPNRCPPSLGKTLTSLRRRVVGAAIQLQYQQTLCTAHPAELHFTDEHDPEVPLQ